MSQVRQRDLLAVKIVLGIGKHLGDWPIGGRLCQYGTRRRGGAGWSPPRRLPAFRLHVDDETPKLAGQPVWGLRSLSPN
jgi:hypothetical protein